MPLTGVGRLVGELGLDVSRFEDGLRRAGSRLDSNLKGWEQRSRQIGDRLGAIGKTLSLKLTAPLLALGGAGLLLASRFGNVAQEMLNLRDAFGLSLDFIQGLKGVAAKLNIPFESVVNIFRRISDLLRNPTEGEDPELVRIMGDIAFTADNELRPMEDIFLDLVDALNKIENPTERARIAQELFGDEWSRVAPLIATGRDEIENVIEETDKLPDSTIEAAAESAAAWEELKLEWQKLGIELSEVLMPLIREVTDFFRDEVAPVLREDVLPAIKDISKAFAGLSDDTKKWIIIGSLLVLALGPLLIILGFVFTAIGTVIGAVKAIGVIFAFLAANPVVLVIAAIVAVIAILVLLWFKWDEVMDFIDRKTGRWAPLIKGLLFFVLLPISLLGTAIVILKNKWRVVWDAMKGPLKSFVSFFEDVDRKIMAIIDRIKGAFDTIKSGLGQGLSLGGRIPGFVNGVRNFGGGLAMVGERGPELVNLPKGSDVIPGAGALGIGSAQGSGNIIIQGDVLDGDHLLRLVGRTGARIINGGGWNKLQRR